MKEFREFRRIKCEYGTTLTITTLILVTAQSRIAERTFGLKLDHQNQDGYDESCFLDFDELIGVSERDPQGCVPGRSTLRAEVY